MKRARHDPQRYLDLGDRLLRRGRTCLAGLAYARAADLLTARVLLGVARGQVAQAPLEALRTLAEVERRGGVCPEGRALLGAAYQRLGRPDLARAFLTAAA